MGCTDLRRISLVLGTLWHESPTKLHSWLYDVFKPLNAIISSSPYSPSIILSNNMFSETPFHKQLEQAARNLIVIDIMSHHQ